MAILLLLGEMKLVSADGTLFLGTAGFALAGLTSMVPVYQGRNDSPRRTMVLRVLGVATAALWAVAPVLALAGGYGWTELFGGRRRSAPFWVVATMLWVLAALVLSAVVRHWQQSRRPAQRRDSDPPAD